MSKKTVLVLPRHSPKSGVRNEKTLIFFGGGSGLEALLPRYLSRYPHLYNYSSILFSRKHKVLVKKVVVSCTLVICH